MKTVFVLLTGVLLTTTTFAHPPKSIQIKYSKPDKQLSIEAVHAVKNVADHYINEILITINGVEKEKITLTKQSSTAAEQYIYAIGDLKTGDVVKVKATCNKIGSKTTEITIQ